jgi:hypothetical protein
LDWPAIGIGRRAIVKPTLDRPIVYGFRVGSKFTYSQVENIFRPDSAKSQLNNPEKAVENKCIVYRGLSQPTSADTPEWTADNCESEHNFLCEYAANGEIIVEYLKWSFR